MTKVHYRKLFAIADRIDSAHEEALASSYFDGVFSDGELAENGFIRLPKDADGVPIHIGDVMESGDGDVFVVSSVDYGHHPSRGYGKFWMLWSDDADFYELAYECRHHKQPTVEDVLREMLDAWGELPSNATNEAIIAEYAAKLRLAESEES